jgi:hypothetical protein
MSPISWARNQKEVDRLKKQLLEKSPFFHGVLLNPETEVYLTILTLKKEVINAKERELFVNNELLPKILAFEADTGFDIRISGMPYIRND